MGSSLLPFSQPSTSLSMAAAPSRSRATRPPQSHGPQQQQQRAGRTAAAATSSLHHQAGVSVSATPAARGAAQAAFLQLMCSVRDEVDQQRRMVHDVFADLCLRCDELIGPGADRPPAPENQLHGALKSDRPAHSADRAFSVPAQPFRFDTAAPSRAALSNSLSQLYSDVQRLEQPDAARDSKQCDLIAEVTLTVDEGSPSASPLDDELQHPQPPPPRRPSSPRRSSSPPLKRQQSQAAAHVLASTGQPADQLALSVMADAVAAERDQPTNGSTTANAVSTTAFARSSAPIAKAGAATSPMLDPRPSISSSLADFPALQRVAAQRAASLQMAAAPAPVADPFPSLSRALLLRQQRLQACSNSVLPSHAPPSASAAVPSAMAPGARPLALSFATSSTDSAPSPAAASTPIHRAPAAPFGINPDASAPIHARSVLDASEQHDDAAPAHPVLSAEEEERRSVQSLLKQQALNLICNQVQMRVKQLTRQRFFLSWQWRCKLSHLATTLARRKLVRTLRIWRWATFERMQQKNRAATKIQSWVRGRQAATAYPSLRLAARHHRHLLLQHVWQRWLRRHDRLQRWRRRWSAKVATWGAAHLHRHVGLPFPARRWRSEEGTMVMAEQFRLWRLRCRHWCAWVQFMTMQRQQRQQ